MGKRSPSPTASTVGAADSRPSGRLRCGCIEHRNHMTSVKCQPVRPMQRECGSAGLGDALYARLSRALKRADELVDLLAAETTLATGSPVGLQISHIRPATDRAERDAQRVCG